MMLTTTCKTNLRKLFKKKIEKNLFNNLFTRHAC